MSTATEKRKLPKTTLLPQWRVLLHNDDVNLASAVIRAIVQFTPLSKEEAVQKAIEAHHQDVALLLITHQELAELYRDQFAACHPPIIVTIEPAT